MSNNIALSPPPVETDLISPFDNKKINSSWMMWLNKLSYYITNSNRNVQAISAASAVNLDARSVTLTTTSTGYAITLDVPTITGIQKTIELTSYTGGKNVTLALTNCIGGSAATTCTWNGVNQALLLESLATKWVVIKERGVTLS